MARPTTSATALNRALTRAQGDADFRARVLNEGPRLQAAEGLSDTDWRTLVLEVERLERTLAADPFAVTEVDQGEADAAGSKG